MSYSGLGEFFETGLSGYGSGMGAYYEFSPHQVYSGYGAVDTGGIRETFNATQVNTDAQLGGGIGAAVKLMRAEGCNENTGQPLAGSQTPASVCQAMAAQLGKINAAGGRATKQIQLGLIELGYDPGPVDGMWGPLTQAGWNNFKTDHGFAATTGPGVHLPALQAMETSLRGGETPGPDEKAGISKVALALAALALLGLGAIALKKRKKGRAGGARQMSMGRRL